MKDFKAYTLDPLDLKSKPYSMSITNEETTQTAKLIFQVCEPVKTSNVPAGCSDQLSTSYLQIDGEDCQPMTPDNSEGGGKTKWSSELSTVKSGNKTIKSFILTGSNSNQHNSIAFNITCDKKIKGHKDIVWSTVWKDDVVYISAGSNTACGYSIMDLIDFLKDNKTISGPIFIIFGLLLCLFGYKFFKYSLMAVGALIGFGIVLGIAQAFNALRDADTNKKIIIFVFAGVVAVLMGFIFYKFERICTITAIGILFSLAAFSFFYFFLQKATDDWKEWPKYLIYIGSGLLGALLGYSMKKFSLVIGTSIGGSALIILSILMFVHLAKWNKDEDINNMPTGYYILGGCWVCLFIVGVVVQTSMYLRDQKYKREEDEWKGQYASI